MPEAVIVATARSPIGRARSAPLSSAAATISSAMRSLTEPPGLKYSNFASTVAPGMPRVTDLSRTSGVFPTSPLNESWTCMLRRYPTLITTRG